jgi:hypothetical protein
MRPVGFFGAGSGTVFVSASALSIYAFDLYEHTWGRGGSLQVEAWLSLIGALVAMGSFGIAAAFAQRTHSNDIAFVLGAACSILFIAVCWFLSSFEFSGSVYIALFVLVLICSLASLTGTRFGGHTSEP